MTEQGAPAPVASATATATPAGDGERGPGGVRRSGHALSRGKAGRRPNAGRRGAASGAREVGVRQGEGRRPARRIQRVGAGRSAQQPPAGDPGVRRRRRTDRGVRPAAPGAAGPGRKEGGPVPFDTGLQAYRAGRFDDATRSVRRPRGERPQRRPVGRAGRPREQGVPQRARPLRQGGAPRGEAPLRAGTRCSRGPCATAPSGISDRRASA